MGISENGLRLAILDTVRHSLEQRLQAQTAQLEVAMQASRSAERRVTECIRQSLSTQRELVETTNQMQSLIHGVKP